MKNICKFFHLIINCIHIIAMIYIQDSYNNYYNCEYCNRKSFRVKENADNCRLFND